MRGGTIDYLVHYETDPAKRAAAYDWNEAHYDFVIGGTLNEDKSRNPTLRHHPYDLLWTEIQTAVAPMETWLTANGYSVEDAYLHNASTSKTLANRKTITIWNSPRFYMNPGDPGYRAWRLHVTQQMTGINSQGHRSDSLFLDEMNTGGTGMNTAVPALEYASTSTYYTDMRSLLTTTKTVAPAGYLLINPADYWLLTEGRANAVAAGAVFAEFALDPYTEVGTKWTTIDSLVNNGAIVDYGSRTTPENRNQARYDMNNGLYNTIRERTLMWEQPT